MIKKKIASALILLTFVAACKKKLEQPADWSSIAVIQASPTTIQNINAGIKSDTLNVFFDAMKYNSTGLTYNTNSGYLPVLTGSHSVNIRRTDSLTTNYVTPFSYTGEKSKAYSFFVYDTTSSLTGQAKVLRLRDDLTLPASGNSHIRFLHLAPNAPAVDITLIRTATTPTGTPALATPDSTTITNKTYIGATPNEDALSPFTIIPRGTLYTVKVKAAGTQTVLFQTTLNLTQSNTGGSDVNQGRIVTIYATGTAKSRTLTVGNFRHY